MTQGNYVANNMVHYVMSKEWVAIQGQKKEVKQVPGGPAEDCVGDEQGGQQLEGGHGVQEMSGHT